MTDRRVLRMASDGALAAYADLSVVAPRRTNDMVVDRLGRAYVGNFGFDYDRDEPVAATTLVLIQGARLTAFDIASDGSLSNRRLWARLPDGVFLDGICLDADSSGRDALRLNRTARVEAVHVAVPGAGLP